MVCDVAFNASGTLCEGSARVANNDGAVFAFVSQADPAAELLWPQGWLACAKRFK
jgi:hypothetical protein